MSPADNPASDGDKASIREVYNLVDDVRNDLGGRIDAVGARITEVVSSHDHRLTVLEAGFTAHARTLDAHADRLDGHGRDLGVLRDRQREDEAATKALQEARSRLTDGRRWLIGTAVAGAAAVAIVVPVFVH